MARACPSRLCLHSGLHIGICCTDQTRESHCIAITSGTKLHVAHKLAGAFQNIFRVVNLSPSKESDIHVSPKDIDVSKCRVSDACRRMTIVQALAYVVPALTHGLKPILGNFAQFARMLPPPCIDGSISPGRIGESKELAHIRTWTWPNDPGCRHRRSRLDRDSACSITIRLAFHTPSKAFLSLLSYSTRPTGFCLPNIFENRSLQVSVAGQRTPVGTVARLWRECRAPHQAAVKNLLDNHHLFPALQSSISCPLPALERSEVHQSDFCGRCSIGHSGRANRKNREGRESLCHHQSAGR
jgi:hypothetical protein